MWRVGYITLFVRVVVLLAKLSFTLPSPTCLKKFEHLLPEYLNIFAEKVASHQI